MANRNNYSDEVLDGFNPFATKDPIMPSATTSAPRPVFTQAILPDTPKPNLNQNEKALRDIEERERALNALESKIQKRENELNNQTGSSSDIKMNNFPPMPACCPCKPCFYQDIDVDIPMEHKYIVKLGFYIWFSYSILLFVNIFGALCNLITSNATSEIGAMFGVSLLMCLIMPPLGYILWFRPLYRAFRSQSSINFFVFFLIFGIFIILVIIQVLGINYLGSCGWINSSVVMKMSLGISLFMMVIALGFTLILVFSIFLYVKVHRTYRTTGASFSKAKAEMRNESVSAALHA